MNKQLTPKTIKMLRRIQEMILVHPKQFYMAGFFRSADGIPRCGTAACIAGWACTLRIKTSSPKKGKLSLNGRGAADLAEEILGLSQAQSLRLFWEDEWPKKFHTKFPEMTIEFAKNAAKRINHFIKTDGEE